METFGGCRKEEYVLFKDVQLFPHKGDLLGGDLSPRRKTNSTCLAACLLGDLHFYQPKASRLIACDKTLIRSLVINCHIFTQFSVLLRSTFQNLNLS
jgi:hypothetical protein